MITINLTGGLGNQLFQIFFIISKSIDDNVDYCFPRTINSGDRVKTYWDNMFIKIANKTKNTEDLDSDYKNIIEKKFNHYDYPNINNVNKNIKYIGYFQSYLYFQKNYKKIIKLLQINKLQKQISQDMNNIIYNNNDTIFISLHFRFGDYLNLQDYYKILPVLYYKKAMYNVLLKLHNINDIKQKQKINILCFYENNNLDLVDEYLRELSINLSYCEENNEGNEGNEGNKDKKINDILNNVDLTFTKIGDYNLEDYEELILMSLCNHNIISNSTFSWWGSMFNTNNNKIVCYPDIWFGPKLANNIIDDLFMPSWDKIEIYKNTPPFG